MSIRGSIAERAVGGPRFRPQPDKLLVEVQGRSSVTELFDQATEERPDILERPPAESRAMKVVRDELQSLGFNTKQLDNLGVVVAETNNLENVMNTIIEAQNTFNQKVVQQVKRDLDDARRGLGNSVVGGFRPGTLNFGSSDKASLEADLRNKLTDISLKNSLTAAVEEFNGVVNAEMNYTRNTPGPRNLNLDVVSDGRTVNRRPLEEDGDGEDDGENSGKPHVGDAIRKFGGDKAWQIDTGERAIAAIFDTSFCEDRFQEDRIIGTFSGDDVESAFSAPKEGHGTMTAYSMAGNKEGHDLPYHGVAKDSDLLLARLSDADGGLVYVAEAWDWLIGWIKKTSKPIISNHSYGVPLCSAVSMDNCTSTTTKLAALANQRSDHQAFYAAGNEALYCGHRLGGITNGINGINSHPTSITGAAFRYDLQDAQNYSSHGFGTCASVDINPKPDLGCILPDIVPYGCEEKDMSMGQGGSGGGTSEATPLTAGVATIVASVTGTAERSVIENVLEGTADQVRTTQVNIVRNHDARFGNGQVNAEAAVKQAQLLAPDQSPIASFTYQPSEPTPEDIINFNGAGSTDPDGDIQSYQWDFGDGQSATGQNVSHSYDEAGNYNVTLTVTDSRNNTDSVTLEVLVQGPPEAEFVVAPENPAVGVNTTFNAEATTDPNQDIVSYEWDFDDGTANEGVSVTHTFQNVGEYDVMLRVTDSRGLTDTETEEVGVSAEESANDTQTTSGFGFGLLNALTR